MRPLSLHDLVTAYLRELELAIENERLARAADGRDERMARVCRAWGDEHRRRAAALSGLLRGPGPAVTPEQAVSRADVSSRPG